MLHVSGYIVSEQTEVIFVFVLFAMFFLSLVLCNMMNCINPCFSDVNKFFFFPTDY